MKLDNSSIKWDICITQFTNIACVDDLLLFDLFVVTVLFCEYCDVFSCLEFEFFNSLWVMGLLLTTLLPLSDIISLMTNIHEFAATS